MQRIRRFSASRFVLQRPREDGMLAIEERPAVHSLCDRLEAEVIDAADGWIVTRYVTDGSVYPAYYVLPAPRRRANLTAGYDPYQPEGWIRKDPDWAILQQFAPDAWQRQMNKTNGREAGRVGVRRPR